MSGKAICAGSAPPPAGFIDAKGVVIVGGIRPAFLRGVVGDIYRKLVDDGRIGDDVQRAIGFAALFWPPGRPQP
jgi:hypothetical protein